MITMFRKLNRKGKVFWILCLFLTINVLVANLVIEKANAAIDPNKILTSSDIPDSILLAKLTTLADLNSDGNITVAELAGYTGSLDLSSLNLTSIQGLGYASGVSQIDLSGNTGLSTIQDNVFLDCTNLTKIVLPDSIVSIGNSAFEGCASLSDINLPVNLTTIGTKSFLQCTSLSSISLPEIIASIGDSAFSGSGLTSVVIPNPTVNIGASCFNGCTSLTSVTLPEGMTLIPMECFKSTGLTTVDFPSTLQTINEGAFNGSALIIIDLSNCTGLTSVKTSAFSGTPVTSVSLPESLTELGSRAFENCLLLPQITIPQNITIINSLTFSQCLSLENVIFTPVSENNYKLQEIGALAFNKCSNLGYSDGHNVTFLANLNNLLTIGDRAFAYCTEKVYKGDGVTPLKDEYNQQVYTGIQGITLPDNLVNLGNGVFSNCCTLTNIVIPNKITELKSQTFLNCYSLSDVTLSSTLTAIGTNCFENCKVLNALTFPETLTTIGGSAFLNCALEKYKTVDSKRQYVYTGLPSLAIPDSVTEIGASAFKGCFNLSSVTLPTYLTKLNDSVFQGCGIQNKSETGALIADSYRGFQAINVPSTLTSIGISTFRDCYNLSDFDFKLAGNLTAIGSYAFANTDIQGILRIPEKITAIKDYVFQGCSGITYVELPDGLTSIGSSSFKNCTGLTSVTLPAVTTFVRTGINSSFYGCYNFTNAILKAIPVDISVNENASVILPVKCFYTINSVEMGDENLATAVIDPTKAQVTINGVGEGQTTATVKGTIQYEIGKDPVTNSVTVNLFDTQVQFNVIVTAKKCTFVSLPQSLRGMKLSTTKLTLTPTILPSDTTDLKEWSSDNPSVATVSSTGIVTAVAYGTTTIRLKVGDLPEVQCQVNVCAPAYTLNLNKTTATLLAGEIVTLIPTVSYSSAYDSYKNSYPEVILWSSSNPNVATVNESGVVTAVKYGTTTITARADAAGITRSCAITVNPSSTAITFNKTSMSVLKGNTATITMTVTPSDLPSNFIKVVSSNTTVASVSVTQNTITVTAKYGGKAIITATPTNGTAATCNVSVISPLTSITTTAMSLNLGASKTLNITKTPSDATDTLVFTSNNTGVVTVDSNGKVTAVGAGSALIHISSKSNPSVSADCNVSVVVLTTGVSLNTASAKLYNHNSLQLVATVVPGNATNKNVIWSSNNTAVATVNSSGKVTAVNPGTAIIKVTTVSGNYSAICTVTVAKINEVGIKATDATASESGTDTGKFIVTRTYGSTATALTVKYTMSGTATNGTDYNTLSGSVIIPAGSTTATIALTPKNDTTSENNETVIITLAGNSSYIIGTAKSATVTIYDNDKNLVSIKASDATASEPGTDTGKFTVTRTYGSTATALTVKYTMSGTATNGTDYNTLSGSVIIPAGSTTATITLTPKNDTTSENNETVIITLAGNSSYIIGTAKSATVTIYDNDKYLVSIKASDATAGEPGTDTGKFTVTRAYGSTATALTVKYTMSGTATNGTDYNTLSGSVIIPVGSTTATITLTPKNDTTKESSESVIATLVANSAYNIGSAKSATVTITDND